MNKTIPQTFNKKAAIELSMNTLVIIIISLVILGSGIALLYQFIGSATDTKKLLDERTNTELEHLLVDQGKQVALPLHVATLSGGESHLFGVGILNSDAKKFGTEFVINIELNKFIDKNNEDKTTELQETAESWLLYTPETIKLEENENTKESILVDIPADAPKGQYIYDVIIKAKDNKPYGTKQKMIVNVK
jgi:hypothetical protein